MKFYAVKKGKKPGIYHTWDECRAQVVGFSGAIYKSFKTEQEALDFINDDLGGPIDVDVIAYVDGSYNIKTKVYGYGGVLIAGGEVVEKFHGVGDNDEDAKMRNVAGEIMGSLKAIELAIKHDYKGIAIYYDYEGIEKWANKLWKANKPGTKDYVKKIEQYRNQIDIAFVKVLAHSGDYYNEIVDDLAKKAVGVL